MAGFRNGTVYADNVDFTGNAIASPQVTTDGQVLIGATAEPHIRVGTIADGNNLTWTKGAGTLQANLTGTTNHAIQVGNASGNLTSLSTGTAGQILQSGGDSADPSFSTATYPTAAGATGTILRSDGTNWVATTATYPSTAGTAGKVLISNGTNIVSSTPTFPNASATAGKFIRSDGTNWVASTPTLPTSAGTSGKVLQSNGTNYVESTPTYPSASGSTGTILRSDGTNNVYTTATYPATTTINRILYSSSGNVIGEISAVANSVLISNGSSVPSMGTSLDNNFTFTTSTAGGSRTLTVSNTDNTNASSFAIYDATVGGTSAGDPFYRSAVGSTRSFAWGIDNSDSQSFKINTTNGGTVTTSSGTNIVRLDTFGNMALPLNACATADLGTGLTNATGDGTFINPVIFDNDSGGGFFDQGSNYDVATGLFTAPVTGKYLVSAAVTFNNLTSSHTSGIIRINTNGGAFAINQFNPGASKNASDEFTATITCIVSLSATGTCAILAQVSGSTKTVGVKGNTSGSFTRASFELIT